jgi:hypothetical protein
MPSQRRPVSATDWDLAGPGGGRNARALLARRRETLWPPAGPSGGPDLPIGAALIYPLAFAFATAGASGLWLLTFQALGLGGSGGPLRPACGADVPSVLALLGAATGLGLVLSGLLGVTESAPIWKVSDSRFRWELVGVAGLGPGVIGAATLSRWDGAGADPWRSPLPTTPHVSTRFRPPGWSSCLRG